MALSSKGRRKTRRVARKVCQEWGITISEDPTKHLLICNAGLVTGTSLEDLVQVFHRNGVTPSATHLLRGKSYSFASFAEVGDASDAFDAVHDKESLLEEEEEKKKEGGDEKAPPLYLAFVEAVPEAVVRASRGDDHWLLGPPPGLLLLPDFVSEEEEELLLRSVPWEENCGGGRSSLRNRQVRHFGYDFVYGRNAIADQPNGSPFPSCWLPVLERAVGLGHLPELPDQCTANRYGPGHGIPPHVDAHSCCTGHIASLSLGSDVVMNFAVPTESGNRPVMLPRRSLMVMSGEARYLYTHGIVPRATDVVPSKATAGLTLLRREVRVSLTFRKVLRERCQCNYPSQCDSRRQRSMELDEEVARALERDHVHDVYERIAGHFSDTRHSAWPRVVEFVSSLPDGAVLLDAGCGNGKYLGAHRKQFQVGCDRSSGLVKICGERGFEAVVGDCLHLPFRDEVADGVISIAVIHHFSTKSRRLRAIKEIVRLLRPGGRALIYAWARDQRREETGASSYLKGDGEGANCRPGPRPGVPAESKAVVGEKLVLPVHRNRTDFQHADLLVPWRTTKRGAEEKKDGETTTLHRFYHVWEEGELESAVEEAAGDAVEVKEGYYDQGNWCVILRKGKGS